MPHARKYRTPRVTASKAAEAVATYGVPQATTRFNVVVPKALKRAIDEQAHARHVSGPELARRLLAEGVEKLRKEAMWERARKLAPLLADRDLKLLAEFDRIIDSWGPLPR